jgi:CheY-like chemotaxis protein
MSTDNDVKIRILMVDDDSEFTDLMQLNLEKRGYVVRVLNNPLNVVKEGREFEPDVILLDFIMKELDGGEVLSTLKRNPNLFKIPVIMISALAATKDSEGEESKPKAGGPSSVIPKPVDLDLLVDRIEKSVAKKTE